MNKIIICVGQFIEVLTGKPMDWDRVYAELEWAKKQAGELPPKSRKRRIK